MMFCFVVTTYGVIATGVIVMGIYIYIYIYRAVTDMTAFDYENKWMQTMIQVVTPSPCIGVRQI